MRHYPASGAGIIMLRSFKMHGMPVVLHRMWVDGTTFRMEKPPTI